MKEEPVKLSACRPAYEIDVADRCLAMVESNATSESPLGNEAGV
jgi:hypothetical protein